MKRVTKKDEEERSKINAKIKYIKTNKQKRIKLNIIVYLIYLHKCVNNVIF